MLFFKQRNMVVSYLQHILKGEELEILTLILFQIHYVIWSYDTSFYSELSKKK
jgi:hypothetical protein